MPHPLIRSYKNIVTNTFHTVGSAISHCLHNTFTLNLKVTHLVKVRNYK